VLLVDCLALVEGAGWITERPLIALGLIGCGGVFLVAPMLIVRVWRARPLAPGPLRSSLEATCRKLGLKYRDIMVWRTGGVVANAGVMGLAAPVRYILLSDALLASLDAEQVRAIFAHEAGHIVHRHIPYMILLILGVKALCFSVGGLAGWWLWGGEPPMAAQACGVLAVVAALVLAFGLLSRRFERQADVFAAASAGTGEQDDPDRLGACGVDVFSGALLEVARLNAIPLGRRNFRHGSIRTRVRYLADLLARGVGPGAVNRRIAAIKAGIWVLVALGAAAVTVAAIARHLTGAPV
jgi:STE24 endopeptidase